MRVPLSVVYAIFMAVVACSVVVGPTSATASSAVTLKTGFSTCHKLNRTFHHGVMTNHYNRREWRAAGATGRPAYRPRLYARVADRLDHDDDGIACEK